MTTSKNVVKQKRKEAQYEREEREMKRLHTDQPSQEFIECDFEEFESFNPSTSNTHKHTRDHNQLRNFFAHLNWHRCKLVLYIMLDGQHWPTDCLGRTFLRYNPHLNCPELSILLSIIMDQFGLESRVTRFAQMDLETCFLRYLHCESYRSLTKK